MLRRFYRGLTLMFLARQGYWVSDKKVSSPSLWAYTYPFLLSTVGIFLTVLLGRDLVSSFLEERKFFQILPYDQLTIALGVLILVAGVAYENYFTLKCQTKETLSLFFNIPQREFAGLMLVKNLILILPVLVAGHLFNLAGVFVVVFLANHWLGVKFLSLVLGREWRKPQLGVAFSYILSLIDALSLTKCVLKPFLNMSLFLMLFENYPEYFIFKLSSPGVIALFVGLLAYQPKGLAYQVFALMKDLPYLKVSGLQVASWLRRLLLLSLSLTFLPSLIPSLVMSWYQAWSPGEFLVFVLVQLTIFLGLQGYQLVQSLYFQDKQLTSVRDLELYQFTVTERVGQVFKQGLLLLVYPLAYLFREHLQVYSWLLSFAFLFSFYVQSSRVIGRLAT